MDLSKASGESIGLLLPRISLEDVNTWGIGGDGKGVYIRNGNAWTPVKSSAVFSSSIKVVSFDLIPSGTNISIYIGGTQPFTTCNFIRQQPLLHGNRFIARLPVVIADRTVEK